MATVGIIANPASGKDIRRLVAHGSVFDNHEKVNIVRRVLVGLQAAGVDEVVFMPDYFAIGHKAVQGLHLDIAVSHLDTPLRGEQQDSTDAARLMAEMGVGCIVTLGGDGTNRAVAKTCGDVPLVAISTGTNNVFPQMIEGTVAGLAAGTVARRLVPVDQVASRARRMDILRDGQPIDMALVDVVVYDDIFIGSRAIWDMSRVRAVVLSRAEPGNIGLSSVGGNLYCHALGGQHGVYLEVAHGPVQVAAPIAPGLIERVGIAGYRLLAIGDSVEVTYKPSLLALDGEREVEVRPDMQVSIRLSDRGPLVVDVGKALQEAARRNAFVQGRGSGSANANHHCLLLAARICLAPPGACLESSPACSGAEGYPDRNSLPGEMDLKE